MLIGLTQQSTRCGGASCQAHEDLIAGFSAIETEAELVQIRLKLRAAAVIGSQQECFQVADGFVQPMQIAGLIFFRVQRNAGQIPIASVAVAFDFCTCRNSFADDLLKCFARDVFNDLHPLEQSRAIFRAKDSYGYQIIKDMKPYLVLSESTLYTILKRLEAANMLTVRTAEHSGRLRKYYRITEAGLKRIEEFKAEWEEILSIYRFVTKEDDDNE